MITAGVRVLSVSFFDDFFQLVPAAVPITRHGLAAVLHDAVRADDPPRASAAYRTLMDDLGQYLIAYFHERDLVRAAPHPAADQAPGGAQDRVGS